MFLISAVISEALIIILCVAGLIIFSLIATLIKAAFYKDNTTRYKNEKTSSYEFDTAKVEDHLSQAIKIPTISQMNENDVDWKQFDLFGQFLQDSYPCLHSNAEKTVIGKNGLIYYIEGQDPSLAPVALIAHQDVVPVTPGTENDWTYPPFSGHNDGEYIWGRGALDMKNHLICALEATEYLLKHDWKPLRGLYILLGYNEEIVASDSSSAKMMAQYLKNQGIRTECIIDEGGGIIPVNIKGVIDKKIAAIGVSEKGYLDIELSVEGTGGHSSVPPAHTALGILSKAICRIENHPYKAKMPASIYSLLDKLGRNCSYKCRLITCNLRLLKPAVTYLMGKVPASASLVRTCTAVTMCSASPAPNVLPQRASAVMNMRLMPGISIESAVKRLKRIIRDDRVNISVIKGNPAPKVSPDDSFTYKLLEKLLVSYEDKRIVVPYIVMGATDSRYYSDICDNIYRISPFEVSQSLLLCTHGTNERIPVSVLKDGVNFFIDFISQSCSR